MRDQIRADMVIGDQVIDVVQVVEIVEIVPVEFLVVRKQVFCAGVVQGDVLGFAFRHAIGRDRFIVDAVGADEAFGKLQLFQVVVRDRAEESTCIFPVIAANHNDIRGVVLAQIFENRIAVCDDADFFAAEIASQYFDRRSRPEENGVPILDVACRQLGNRFLFFFLDFLFFRMRKLLVQCVADALCSAVDAQDFSGLIEFVQIPAHGHVGNIQLLDDIGYGDDAFLVDDFSEYQQAFFF